MPSDRFDANAGFSVNNTTVIDANRNILAVGATFNTVSASNIANSVNGRTGNVGLPLANSSLTGIASFNATYFSVSATGQVSLAPPYSDGGVAPVVSAASKIYAYRGFR